MNLDIKELKECKLVDSLNVIRKHSNVAMATHAKNLRSFLKEQVCVSVLRKVKSASLCISSLDASLVSIDVGE